jgi:glycosyltransferase involved in cell wall biosynthesis
METAKEILRGKDIIVFSEDWGRHPCSCQHLFERLIPSNRVLWVNTIGYRKIKFNRYDFIRSAEKILNWLKNSKSETVNHNFHKNLKIINPICLPFGKYRIVRNFNAISISRSIKKVVDEWHFEKPLVLTTLPHILDTVKRLGQISHLIYYCVDDYSLWPGFDGDLMLKLEQELISEVDLIIATSEKLAHTRKKEDGSTQLVTHGVDVEHFQQTGKINSPTIIDGLKSPVVGYYGLVDERCDLSLIEKVAQSMPNVSFLIIGDWRVSYDSLAQQPNIRIIGKVNYQDLPAYLAPVSVLILPYKTNALAESINPLKIKEYLATGLPVVATPLPEVKKLYQFIDIGSTHNEFISAIKKALNKDREYPAQLSEFLKMESWEEKAKQFSAMIEAL